MRIEDQVCSLKLAKKLKKLRVEQESVWGWFKFNPPTEDKYLFGFYHDIYKTSPVICKEQYSAFTVAELGEKLKWKALMIFGMPDDIKKMIGDNDTEANVRAKMLIYLKGKKPK